MQNGGRQEWLQYSILLFKIFLPILLLYEPPDSAVIFLCYREVDPAAVLLLMVSVNSETSGPRLAAYRSMGSISIHNDCPYMCPELLYFMPRIESGGIPERNQSPLV